MPAARAPVRIERAYSDAEFASIAEGVIPREMEDKWFIYHESPWLYLHRSWTGYCVYAVRFERRGDEHHVVEAWVSRDPQQYTGNDDDAAEEAELLGELLDHLAGREAPPNVKDEG